MSPRERIALIGYGHPSRGDDAAGPLVARRLRGMLPAAVDVHEVIGDGTALMEAWGGCDRAVVVDAMVSGAPPGTVHRLDGRRLSGAGDFRSPSSHALGLREAIRLAEMLGRLPGKLDIIGIEGRRFETGEAPGPEVQEGIARAAAVLLDEFAATAGSAESAARTGAEQGAG